ncbi:MAG TPA: glucose-1-phosphate cytidylyltransferase [Steroidobacteraceae bacterium]|nr:glucose-1-phosphate cytidylyltransferase [Steroidobacteraceae bacterium]
MKVGILAGGIGSRLAEETVVRPKPMVEIGGRPILWHIMMHYSTYGFKEFVVALGYKGEHIKRYMADYCSLAPDLRVSLKTGRVERQGNGEQREDWVVDLIDTGQQTNTGGRIKRLGSHLGTGTFMLTWGDGVSNLNLTDLIKFHRGHGRIATVTAVRPPARFGRLELEGDRVARFDEKPLSGEAWINGAFFVLEPRVFDYIEGDATQFEREPLERLASDGQLMAYRHNGFWQCMDTMRDKVRLESLWASGDAPWKIWK